MIAFIFFIAYINKFLVTIQFSLFLPQIIVVLLFRNERSNSWGYPWIYIIVSPRFFETVVFNLETFIRILFELFNEFYKCSFILYTKLFRQTYVQFGDKIIHISLTVVVFWTFSNSFIIRWVMIIKKTKHRQVV